jgi:hypothetical protein
MLVKGYPTFGSNKTLLIAFLGSPDKSLLFRFNFEGSKNKFYRLHRWFIGMKHQLKKTHQRTLFFIEFVGTYLVDTQVLLGHNIIKS